METTGERIEPLENGLVIIRGGGFTYGSDALLLMKLFRARSSERVIDLGCGTGILSILAAGRTGARVTAIDIQEECCALLRRSAELNGQRDIEVLCADMREAHELLGRERFDVAVCNPPYYAGGTKSPDASREKSVHQGSCTVGEAAKSASRLLRNGGRLYICYPASGAAELFVALCSASIEPKRAGFALSKRGEAPYLIVCEAKKLAKPGLVWEKPSYLDAEAEDD